MAEGWQAYQMRQHQMPIEELESGADAQTYVFLQMLGLQAAQIAL